MQPFVPWDWADPSGYPMWLAIVVVILAGVVAKLVSPQWDDWLDERWGRGSVRDWWLLDRVRRRAGGDVSRPSAAPPAGPPGRTRR